LAAFLIAILMFSHSLSIVEALGYVWYAGCTCVPDSHPYRITSTKCLINTVVSPDDEHIVARNT